MQDYTALKDAIATCRAAEQGFRGAANSVKTPTLRGMFEQYSIQRGEFANELLRAARGLGLDVGNPYGISGMLHAGWMELKGAFTGQGDRRILEECERGEEYALDTYRQALRLNLHPEIRAILQRQIADIETARVHIGTLIDTFVRDTADDRTRKAG
jgi:uncharacterized protein (TIGR02284 family)